jgi:ADP-ribosylglycohydrolase
MLKGGALAAVAAGLFPSSAAETVASASPKRRLSLREKFFGCITGVHLGSAMGAPVENWTWQKIEQQYGTLDRLLPYQHYENGWNREPGTTEDGVERQKLMITAMIEKQDRVTAEDVRRMWVRDIKPESAGMVSEPFEGMLLAMAKTSIPASDIGRYCDYSGLVSMARSCHPIGLINAGDIASAIQDVHEVGQLYNSADSRGIRWAEVTVVGIAAATRPNATVGDVMGAIFDNCDKSDGRIRRSAGVLPEIQRGLDATEHCTDFRQLRERFDSIYSGQAAPYRYSYANEVVTKAVCIFRMVKGNTWEAMKASVNMGRDTDCLTAVAAGISGALSGPMDIPPALIRQVDAATAINPYTNSKRTMRETSDALFAAYKARLKAMRGYIDEMDAA